MAAALAAVTAYSNCGQLQWTAAVELDAAGCTNGERLLLWTTALAVAAATAHSNCGRRQLTAAVEWDAAGCTNGERLLLWTTVAEETAVAVPAVAVTVMAADSNWERLLPLNGISPHLAKMADGYVNRNMTNMRKFGFSEYVCETEKIR